MKKSPALAQGEKVYLYNKSKRFKVRDKKHEKQITISDPIVDKIRTMKTLHVRGDMTDFINTMDTVQSFHVETHVPKGWYSASKTFHLPSNDPRDPKATMWVGINRAKSQITFDYCPAKLSDHAYDLMDKDIFSNTRHASFLNFIMDAKVISIDVCRNIFNMKMEDYLFRSSCSRKYGFYIGKDAKIESIYYGARECSQLVIYDKKKQDKKGYRHCDHVGRVEKNDKSPNRLVRDLINYKNPFLRAEIYEFAISRLDCVPKHFRECFKYACWAVGIGNALEALGVIGTQKQAALEKLKSDPWQPWLLAQENWHAEWTEALEAYHLLDSAAQKEDEWGE